MRKQDTKKSPKTKRAAIIETATDLFLEYGYDGTSIDMIANKAGISRQTIYNQYENKEALFSAIIDDQMQLILSPLTSPIGQTGKLRSNLLAFARHLVTTLLHPRTKALYQLAIGETRRFPILGQKVYAIGVEKAEDELASYLLNQSKLKLTDPKIAAQQFFSLVSYPVDIKIIFGIQVCHNDKMLDKQINAAIDTFLSAFRKK